MHDHPPFPNRIIDKRHDATPTSSAASAVRRRDVDPCMQAYDDQVLALHVPSLAQRSQTFCGTGPGVQLAHLAHFRYLLRLGGAQSAEDAEDESHNQGKCLVDHPSSSRPKVLSIARSSESTVWRSTSEA